MTNYNNLGKSSQNIWNDISSGNGQAAKESIKTQLYQKVACKLDKMRGGTPEQFFNTGSDNGAE